MAKKTVTTHPYGLEGRAVKLSVGNAAAVNEAFTRDAGTLTWTPGTGLAKNDLLPKIRLKTPKGIRVAQVGDTIVRYGTRRNGGKVTFAVIKAL